MTACAGFRSLLVGVVGFCAAGCASSDVDRYFDAGQYVRTVEAFEADESLASDQSALFKAGVSYALPDSPAYDAAKARTLLRRLLEQYPDTEYRREAGWILSFLDRQAVLAAALAEVSDSLAVFEASDPRGLPEEASDGAREIHRLRMEGRYARAAAAFEAESGLRSSEPALFNAAVAYSEPRNAERDPRRARELLARLLRLNPDTRYAEPSNRLAALLDLEIGLRQRIRGLEEELEELKAIDLGAAAGDP
jgi:tetratricopeptide (TPR) repeat protein